jgi:hypothetical protein
LEDKNLIITTPREGTGSNPKGDSAGQYSSPDVETADAGKSSLSDVDVWSFQDEGY